MSESQSLGEKGENLAAEYLKKKGYIIRDRNWVSGKKELDIVAENNDFIVFVEVKTREFEKYKNTLPEENITYSKLRKLNKIANAYLRLKNLEDEAYRFDAISVWLSEITGEAKIKHIQSL